MQISSIARLDDVIKDLRFLISELRDNGFTSLAIQVDGMINEITNTIEED